MASAEYQEKKKLSKAEKKAARKQTKSQHLLLKHDGISTSEIPSKFLLIGNGGLINGIQQEQLTPLFSQFGDVEEIVMLPGKPYSFVCFRDIEGAVSAQESLQGYLLREGQGPTNIRMYLSYVKQVPKSPLTCGNLPPGLILLEDFIDKEMERQLLDSIQWDSDSASAVTESQSAQQSLKHRRVKHHGYEFLYTTNNIDKDHPLPDGMPSIFGQVIDDIMASGHVQYRPDQLTINQYQPGQGIPPHIDTHSAFEDAIIALSLGSQVLMEFSHPDGPHIPVLLPSCSLVIMTGEARYLWSHGITPRKGDIVPSKSGDRADDKEGLTLVPRGVRTSLTFRAIRREPCKCDYASKCDSQQNKPIIKATQDHDPSASLPTSEREALILEQTHVHEVYEKIAEHFSDTRHKPWPRVAEFLNKLDPGCVVLDVGCGNGKYLGVNSSLYMIGCDRSQHLVDICRQRQFQAFTSDALELPVRTASVDACICIAVIHHFSTQARREKAVQEIVRILSSGGLALIYVWAVEQERGKQKSNYLKDAKKHKEQTLNSALTKKKEDNKTDVWIRREDLEAEQTANRHKGQGGFENVQMDSNLPKRTISRSQEESGRSQSGSLGHSQEIRSKRPVEGLHEVSRSPGNICGKKVVDQKVDYHDFESTGQKSLVTGNTNPQQSHEQSAMDSHTVSDQDNCHKINNKLPIHKNRTQFVKPDLLVPWNLKIKKSTGQGSPSKDVVQTEPEQSVVYHRYYHVFKEGELEKLCLSIGGTRVVESYYDQGNWCVVFQKN